MIDEDYVNFKIAKLLKEKGFECEKDSVTAMYNEIGTFLPLSTAADEYYDYSDFDEYDFVAPTLQMAMKWLRKKHNLYIVIEPTDCFRYYWIIYFMNTSRTLRCDDGESFITPEQACDDVITYCLENLI